MNFEKYIETTKTFFTWLGESLDAYEQVIVNEEQYREFCVHEDKEFDQEELNFLQNIEFQKFFENGHGPTYLVYYSPIFEKYFCMSGYYDSWDVSDFYEEVYEMQCEVIPVKKLFHDNTTLYIE